MPPEATFKGECAFGSVSRHSKIWPDPSLEVAMPSNDTPWLPFSKTLVQPKTPLRYFPL